MSIRLSAGSEVRGATATTGSVAGTSEADVTVTWDTAFLDTNYTVVAVVVLDEGGESLRVRRIRTLSTTGCVVNVINNAITSKTGTVHAIAVP